MPTLTPLSPPGSPYRQSQGREIAARRPTPPPRPVAQHQPATFSVLRCVCGCFGAFCGCIEPTPPAPSPTRVPLSVITPGSALSRDAQELYNATRRAEWEAQRAERAAAAAEAARPKPLPSIFEEPPLEPLPPQSAERGDPVPRARTVLRSIDEEITRIGTALEKARTWEYTAWSKHFKERSGEVRVLSQGWVTNMKTIRTECLAKYLAGTDSESYKSVEKDLQRVEKRLVNLDSYIRQVFERLQQQDQLQQQRRLDQQNATVLQTLENHVEQMRQQARSQVMATQAAFHEQNMIAQNQRFMWQVSQWSNIGRYPAWGPYR